MGGGLLQVADKDVLFRIAALWGGLGRQSGDEKQARKATRAIAPKANGGSSIRNSSSRTSTAPPGLPAQSRKPAAAPALSGPAWISDHSSAMGSPASSTNPSRTSAMAISTRLCVNAKVRKTSAVTAVAQISTPPRRPRAAATGGRTAAPIMPLTVMRELACCTGRCRGPPAASVCRPKPDDAPPFSTFAHRCRQLCCNGCSVSALWRPNDGLPARSEWPTQPRWPVGRELHVSAAIRLRCEATCRQREAIEDRRDPDRSA